VSVVSVVKLRLDPGDAARILSEAAGVLQGESATQLGFLAAEIFVSHDRKTIVILTEWTDLHAWSKSRYDVRVGKMLEDCVAASSEIEFEIYDRHAHFLPSSNAELVDDDRD
jgi:quinol monooxygenase YgiN